MDHGSVGILHPRTGWFRPLYSTFDPRRLYESSLQMDGSQRNRRYDPDIYSSVCRVRCFVRGLFAFHGISFQCSTPIIQSDDSSPLVEVTRIIRVPSLLPLGFLRCAAFFVRLYAQKSLNGCFEVQWNPDRW